MPANLENSSVVTGLENVSFIPISKKGNAEECSNYHTIALISHASKVMFKILQARLQQYMNCEIQDVQAGFRKDRGTRDQIANIHWIFLGGKDCWRMDRLPTPIFWPAEFQGLYSPWGHKESQLSHFI